MTLKLIDDSLSNVQHVDLRAIDQMKPHTSLLGPREIEHFDDRYYTFEVEIEGRWVLLSADAFPLAKWSNHIGPSGYFFQPADLYDFKNKPVWIYRIPVAHAAEAYDDLVIQRSLALKQEPVRMVMILESITRLVLFEQE